ncbi:hypothetical protein I2I05_00175 [Hymenobacter sp. BT683]|uniref:Uncharacterized protein n=1 Tax=Hymenobacter jeongseonensis TaxID=2791027 RepID=A0ABS0IBS3_9BACT|nr:hypothetical protein [Hymenobacter jeongseonensis]MBF9235799.1 hypothetical protein [Hymenobacter jeongseonensis]
MIRNANAGLGGQARQPFGNDKPLPEPLHGPADGLTGSPEAAFGASKVQ